MSDRRCKRCGASIVWLKTARDAWMPCDNGKTGDIFDHKKHKPHWASCPDAKAFRREHKKDLGGKQPVGIATTQQKDREEPRSPAQAIFIAHDRMSGEAIYRGPNGEQIRLTEQQMMALDEIPPAIKFNPQTLKPILP